MTEYHSGERKHHILLIEDNPLTVKLVTLSLEDQPYQLTVCMRGGQAVEFVTEHKPDLILQDMRLPDIDGLELIKVLRALPNGEDIPIISFSGFVSMVEEARIANAGFTDFLVKPVEPSQLIKCIQNHLVSVTAASEKQGRDRKVLILDDDPLHLKFTVLQFSHAGFEVVSGENGAQGLKLVEAHRPDLIISDVLMPKMDGFAFCKSLRRDPRFANIPVILASANYVEEIDQELAAKVGANGYIYKSSGIQKIVELAFQLLHQPPCAPLLPVAANAEIPDEELDDELHHRMLQQLERQVSLNLANRQRSTVQHTILGQIGAIADTLLQYRDGGLALDEILARCLDSAGLSHGLFYYGDPDSPLVLRAQYGFDNERKLIESAFDQKAFLMNIIRERQALSLPSARVDTNVSNDILDKSGSLSALMVPVAGQEAQGLFVMFSAAELLLEEDWVPFGRSVASQFTQATELSDVFSRLVESEQRFQQLANHVREAFFIYDRASTRLIYLNRAYENIIGRTLNLDDLSQTSIEQFMLEEDRSCLADIDIDSGSPYSVDFRIALPDKTTKWVRSKGYPIKNSQGRIYRVCGTLEDITEEKQAALHIRQLNRLYALLSGINSLVVRATDRSELLADACNIATTIGEFDLVWIGELHHGDNRIYPVAHSGPQEDIDALMSAVYTATTEKGGRQNIIQQTIAGLRPYWENHDLTTFGSGALHLNTYRSIICLPLINSEGVCGIALFYSRRAIVFDAREVAVLTDISKDISHGMSFIATRDRLNHLAFHDPVTGLANRARLRITLEQQIRDARVDNSPLALMLVNIIGFRDINNTFGHSAGDEILGDIAEALRAVQPAHDLIACLGGDEFAIIFPGAGDENTARDTAQRINECLAGTISIVGVPIHIEAQIGVALYPIHADSVDGLWMLADTALSLAASEQSHICIYNTCFDRTDPQSLALLGGVREAIENNQFELYWQPKLDLGANCVVGAEALIRWNHPVRGMLYPDTFIPQIEQTALIRPLTEWVMKAAIQQARQWQDAGYNLSVAINISVRNLQENNLHDRLIDQAREHGVPLEKIVVEVTESAVMGNVTQAVRVLGILANAGIRVAIDDFGTGHSSLVYLRDLPVTDMKIDKAFAMNLGSNGYTAIVKSAIKLAQNLDLSVTAEGVEDGESLAALRDMGCNIAQGYFISRPLRADQFIGWLEASSWRASPLSRSTIDSEKRSPG